MLETRRGLLWALASESSAKKPVVNKLGMVIHPIDDLDKATSFFREGLGLDEAFRDGDQLCAFSLGGVMIGLVAGEERLTDETVLAYKVADNDAAVAHLKASGAELLRGPEEGPHEVRAVLKDPAGHPPVVYSGKAK